MFGRTLQVLALAAFVAALVLPRSAAAQEVRVKSAPPPSPALALETRAFAYLDAPEHWPQLARWLEQAAALRGPDDTQALADLGIAAGAYLSLGKHAQARATYTAAGEQWLALGEVYRAAYNFMMAALVANVQKDGSAAWALKARADRLARSPLITRVQRERILGQFKELPAAASG